MTKLKGLLLSFFSVASVSGGIAGGGHSLGLWQNNENLKEKNTPVNAGDSDQKVDGNIQENQQELPRQQEAELIIRQDSPEVSLQKPKEEELEPRNPASSGEQLKNPEEEELELDLEVKEDIVPPDEDKILWEYISTDDKGNNSRICERKEEGAEEVIRGMCNTKWAKKAKKSTRSKRVEFWVRGNKKDVEEMLSEWFTEYGGFEGVDWYNKSKEGGVGKLKDFCDVKQFGEGLEGKIEIICK